MLPEALGCTHYSMYPLAVALVGWSGDTTIVVVKVAQDRECDDAPCA